MPPGVYSNLSSNSFIIVAVCSNSGKYSSLILVVSIRDESFSRSQVHHLNRSDK